MFEEVSEIRYIGSRYGERHDVKDREKDMDSPVQVFTEISYQGTERDDNERQNRYITGYDIVEPQSPDECFETGEYRNLFVHEIFVPL